MTGDPQMTTVPGVKSATVPEKQAWRLIAGRFITRWVEIFAGLAGGQVIAVLALPPQQYSFNLLIQFLAPTLTATYQALRAAWPTISTYLNNGFRWPDTAQ